jgi:hypothetical protein
VPVPFLSHLVDSTAFSINSRHVWYLPETKTNLSLHFKNCKNSPLETSKSSAVTPSGCTLCAMTTDENEHLPHGPFTDFGQYGPGSLDLRVFLQSEYWVDIEGTGHLLTSMSDDYRSNVIRMLLIDAEVLQIKILYLIIGMIHEAIVNRDADGMESLLQNEIPLLHIEASYDFIENTPLMKRLRELLPNGPTLGDLLLQEIQKIDND